MRMILVVLAFFSFHLSANEIWVTNDTPFSLRAQIFGSDVMYAEQTVPPGGQWHWSNDKVMQGPSSNPNMSTTPFTVIWYCSIGGQPFGTSTNIASGAWVSARNSDGPKVCPLPKKPSATTGSAKY